MMSKLGILERQFIAACQAILGRGTKPIVPEVMPLVQEYYRMPHNGAGGSLHVVLDDNNVERHFVESCLDFALNEHDACGEALARVLLLCSKTQVAKLAAGHNSGLLR